MRGIDGREERLPVVAVGGEYRDGVGKLSHELFRDALNEKLGAADGRPVPLGDVKDPHETASILQSRLRNLMTTSMGRGAIAGGPQSVSRAEQVIRHPLWTAGTVLRGLAASPGPSVVVRALNHLLKRSFPLRLTVPSRRWADGADQSMAVRWAGPINLRHRRSKRCCAFRRAASSTAPKRRPDPASCAGADCRPRSGRMLRRRSSSPSVSRCPRQTIGSGRSRSF